MTEIPEPAKQMAADLANAEESEGNPWRSQEFEYRAGSGLRNALARLCARTIERDALLARMQADMAAIGGMCAHSASGTYYRAIATIAARWQVEADPLVEAFAEHMRSKWEWGPPELVAKRAAEMAELAKRGIALGAAK